MIDQALAQDEDLPTWLELVRNASNLWFIGSTAHRE